MPVTVVIPTWNRAALLHQCIAAIRGTAPSAHVLVVDNGSVDGTNGNDADTYIRLDENTGFAYASNLGAREAATDTVLFLNNDTVPDQPGWVGPMAETVSAGRPIVGAHLTYPDGRTQHAGIALSKPGGVLTATNIDRRGPSRHIDAVTGACMAVHRHTFLDAGGFNESYRNGYEDVDLCLTLGGAWYCDEATVVHLESQTEGRFDHVAHNVRLLNERWGDRWPQPMS